MFAIRAVLAATMGTSWGVLGFELFEPPVREGSEEYLDSEKYELRPRDFEAAVAEGRSLEPFLRRLNGSAGCTRLCQMRTIHFHHVDNEALLAYSKFDPVTGDAVLVVVTLNAFAAEEGTVWLDMPALGMHPYDRFWVRDEITGEEYQWGQSNYVRITPARAVAHILNMPLVPQEQRAALLPGNDGNGRIGTPMTRSAAHQSLLAPDPGELARLVAGVHHNPHGILGAHEYDDHTVIRALKPHATGVVALVGGERHPFVHIDSGVFAVALPFTNLVDYRLEVSYPGGDGSPDPVADGYRFLPTLGRWTCTCSPRAATNGCGDPRAHPRSFATADGVVDGVSFAVWAPNAKGINLIGEFNHWDGHDAPMRVLGSSGVWELFWPGFPDGCYKFRVHGVDGSVTDRADPFAFATEVPPQTASRVFVSDYTWSDGTG